LGPIQPADRRNVAAARQAARQEGEIGDAGGRRKGRDRPADSAPSNETSDVGKLTDLEGPLTDRGVEPVDEEEDAATH
jgi:hypothetical protein